MLPSPVVLGQRRHRVVRQVLLITLALVGAWIPSPASVAQGHHPPGLWHLRGAVVSELLLLGVAVAPGAAPAALSSILALPEAAWRHASRGAAWREQALPC